MILNIKFNPEITRIKLGQISLIWTNHALERAREKNIYIYNQIIPDGKLVEIEIDKKALNKIIVRLPTNNDYDDVLVLVPNRKSWVVVTCWANHRLDNHKTLCKKRLKVS